MRRILQEATFYQNFKDSMALWPVTAVYLFSVAVILMVTNGIFVWGVGVALLGILSMIIITVSMYAELRKVHALVFDTQSALVDRIEQLVLALQDGGILVPVDPNPASAKAGANLKWVSPGSTVRAPRIPVVEGYDGHKVLGTITAPAALVVERPESPGLT